MRQDLSKTDPRFCKWLLEPRKALRGISIAPLRTCTQPPEPSLSTAPCAVRQAASTAQEANGTGYQTTEPTAQVLLIKTFSKAEISLAESNFLPAIDLK